MVSIQRNNSTQMQTAEISPSGAKTFGESATLKLDPATGNFTVNTSTEVVTSSTHGMVTNDIVQLTTTDTLPAGLELATDYYVTKIDADTFTLSTTIGGTAIDITDTGTGTHTFTKFYHEIEFGFASQSITVKNTHATAIISIFFHYLEANGNTTTWNTQGLTLASENASFSADIRHESIRLISDTASPTWEMFVSQEKPSA